MINETMEHFIIRTYTKKKLATMYFPDSNPRTAVNHLMAWIRRDRELHQKLLSMGYTTTCKAFTPREVRTIVDYLGPP